MSKKDAVVKKETAAMTISDMGGSWGSEGVDNADILIPRILLMQPISERVGEGTSQAGDLIKSTNDETLAAKGKSVEVIPIKTFKTWRIMKMINGKYEFSAIEPFTVANSNAALEWIDGITQYRRDRSINFYVLLPSEIAREVKAFEKIASGELPDPDDCLIPCLLSFTRTSSPAGKDLATHFKKAEHFGIPPAVTTFNLSSEFVKNDKGNFYVFKIEKSRKTTMEELASAKKWWETLQSANVKVHEEVESAEVSEPVGMDDTF